MDIRTLVNGIDRSEQTLKQIQAQLYRESQKLQLEQHLVQQQIDNVLHGHDSTNPIDLSDKHDATDNNDIDDVLAALLEEEQNASPEMQPVHDHTTDQSQIQHINQPHNIYQQSPHTIPPLPSQLQSPTIMPLFDPTHSPALGAYTDSTLQSTPYMQPYQHSPNIHHQPHIQSLNLTHTPLNGSVYNNSTIPPLHTQHTTDTKDSTDDNTPE